MGKKQKIKEVQYRHCLIKRSDIDEEKRTVRLAFSSETRVERWGDFEVLDHGDSSVRLERLQENGPLLMDHNWEDQIGIVESVSIDGDRVGRAVVRFSQSKRAQEIYQDVLDGIRKSISVGYRIHKMEMQEKEGEQSTYRATDWEPLEVSIVSVPADTSVGIGRSSENKHTIEELKMTEEQIKEQERKMQEDAQAKIKDQREIEANRIRAINKISGTYKGHDSLREDAIRNGLSVEDFTSKLADAELEKRENQTPETTLDLSDKQIESYSVTRALAAQATGDWSKAQFEREASEAIADKLGTDARGVYVPYDIQKRVIKTDGAAVGAIATDHMAGSFIDNLRDQAIVLQLGAKLLTGLRGNIEVPRKDNSASFTWVNEDEDSVDSDINIGSIGMSPKTVTGSVAMSRRTLLQANPDMDSLVMSDLAHGAALAIDLAALVGASGGKNPVGITNTTGVLTNTIATSGQPTWEEIVNFETLCIDANSLNNAKFVTTAPVRGYLKTAKKDAGSGIFLLEGNATNGYQVHVKTDAGIPANTMIFGDFSQLVIGMWGVLDLVADTATKVKSGGLVIRAFQDVDVAVRHPSGFVKNA